MKESLTDTITPFFENEDLDNFKSQDYRKTILDKIEKQTKGNRKSLNITFNKILESKLKEQGKSNEDFKKPRSKKFSNTLDKSNATKVEIKDDKSKDDFPTTQNPKGKITEIKEIPLGAIAGAGNSFLSAIFEDLEELTQTEKDDIGVCLNMAFGEFINTHDNARKIMGGIGILGIYGGKIKTAKKHKKERQNKQEKQNPSKELPTITKKDKQDFKDKSKDFIENKIETDI